RGRCRARRAGCRRGAAAAGGPRRRMPVRPAACTAWRPCRPRSASTSFPVPLSDGGEHIRWGWGVPGSACGDGKSSRLEPLLLCDEGAFEYVLAGYADARRGSEAAGVEQAAEVGQHLRAAADHGAVVRRVERVEAEVGGDAAAVEQGGQAPALVAAVEGEVLARDGGVVEQLLRDLFAEELVPRQLVDDVVAVGEVAGVGHAVAEHDALEAFVGVRVR